MKDNWTNPPRGVPGHRYAFTKIHPYVAPTPTPGPGPYYPDSSAGHAHTSPGNANEVFPSPYTGPGVLDPSAPPAPPPP